MTVYFFPLFSPFSSIARITWDTENQNKDIYNGEKGEIKGETGDLEGMMKVAIRQIYNDSREGSRLNDSN